MLKIEKVLTDLLEPFNTYSMEFTVLYMFLHK